MKRKYVAVLSALIISVSTLFLKNENTMAKTEEILLPKAVKEGSMSLEESILKRRSVRNFMRKDLSLEQTSQLLWAAQGLTQEESGFGFRASPSAGALYPTEIYLLNKDGFFHYLPRGHKLEVLGSKDLREALSGVALGQESVRKAAADIVICAVYGRVTAKYGERGSMYTHIEAGHIAQNIHLQAVALGLGSVPVGAFSDEGVKKILSLPEDHEPLYIIPVGYPE
ncbi:MAG: SagB/ThcOx family dehydrogenase [Candidatus Omnitrophota bacterium]